MGRAQQRKQTRSACRPASKRREQCKPTRMCKWTDKEMQDLSRFVLLFVRRSGGILPKKSDAAFWTACCAHFQGRFTQLQVHDKARNLKLRFLRFSSDQEKSLKVSARETLQLWAQIRNTLQGTSNGTTGPSKGKAPAGGSLHDKGGAHRASSEWTACTCSTETYVSTESRHGHGKDKGAANALIRADNDLHATPVGGEPAHNVTVFQYRIAADIATTTKNLAEYLNSQGKQATA